MSRLLFRADVNASLTSMDVFIFTRDVAVVLPTGWAPEVRRLPLGCPSGARSYSAPYISTQQSRTGLHAELKSTESDSVVTEDLPTGFKP